jgi:arylsulfatase A-like enzyme
MLMDTTRADHLSLYGYHRRTSPHLEAIAREGAWYENAIAAAPWTFPSHMSLFTGTYPSRHRMTRSQLRLDPSLTTLMGFLRGQGYGIYGVSSNYWLSRASRFNRDFDAFHQSWQLVQAEADRSWKRQRDWPGTPQDEPPSEGWRERIAPLANSLYFQVTRRLRDHAMYDAGAWRVNRVVGRWAQEWRKSERPFFAFVHYMEPHLRYQPPGRFHAMHLSQGVTRRRLNRINQNSWRYVVGRSRMTAEDFDILGGLYDGELSYTDYRIGQIYTLLRDHDLLDSTLLVITSDHGENIGDHGLMGHQYCVYDSLVRVPLVVRYPARIQPNTHVTSQVQLVDLFPTVLKTLEVEDPGVWGQMQGQSLLPEDIDGHSQRPAFAEYLEVTPPIDMLQKRYAGFDGSRYNRTLRAVRTLQHKYIWASDGRDELYDLERDPGETANLIDVAPEIALELRQELEGRLGAEFAAVRSSEEIDVDAVVRKRLEELGYL